jgi:uncharacterized protein (DUF1330 family)
MVMSAFMIFHVKIKDPDRFARYGACVGPTLEQFGGEVRLRGKVASTLAGEHDYHAVGMLEFPDRQSAEAWYNSPDYQALTALRDDAADVLAVCYDSL